MIISKIGSSRAASPLPAAGASPRRADLTALAFVIVYVAATAYVAQADLGLRSLVLVAAVFAILATSLDLVAGMLGLYSLGQGGFFAIGAYLTTIVVNQTECSPFLLLPAVLIVAGAAGLAVGAMSLRVSGLYFAITTFIFTLVLTVLATDLSITGGLQGLLGPAFPDFPDSLAWLGAPVVWCVMAGLLICLGGIWSLRRSPLYPVLLSVRDAEGFAEAAGVHTSLMKIGVFGVSAAMAGGAGWLFSFLGVVSPGQFDWSVSLNILVMVLIGGVNTTLGPLIGAAFVTGFPALVNINPWLQEMAYGALSVLAVTTLPGGLMSLFDGRRRRTPSVNEAPPEAPAALPSETRLPEPCDAPEYAVECDDIHFHYPDGPPVLRGVSLKVRRGAIHGLIGPNGSGKSTLANVIAGRLQPRSGTILIKGARVDGAPARKRAALGMRRTFQAAELVRELTPTQNVGVGLYDRNARLAQRAAIWPLLPSARRDSLRIERRASEALAMVGAAAWRSRKIADVPHGVEQLTQLASVCVAGADIIVLDEPATGLTAGEVRHLAEILTRLKAQGMTMIIIEHQTRFLFPLCDHLTVLNAGEVICSGAPADVRADPIVRQVYLGE